MWPFSYCNLYLVCKRFTFFSIICALLSGQKWKEKVISWVGRWKGKMKNSTSPLSSWTFPFTKRIKIHEINFIFPVAKIYKPQTEHKFLKLVCPLESNSLCLMGVGKDLLKPLTYSFSFAEMMYASTLRLNHYQCWELLVRFYLCHNTPWRF